MPSDPADGSFVTIRHFRDVPVAMLAKAALDSAGIESYLFDDNTIRMDWFWSNAIGGVKLLVRKEDAPAALEMLNAAPLEKFKTDEREEFVQPKCPECGSLDVSFRGLKKRPTYTGFFIGLPVPFTYSNWHCNSCGALLEEAPDDAGAEGSPKETPPKP